MENQTLDMETNAETDAAEAEEIEGVFPVDLRREEYIEFNMLVAKTVGVLRKQKNRSLIFAFFLMISLALLIAGKIIMGSIDILAVCLVGFVMITGGIFVVGLPRHIRRTAARAFDQTYQGGYTFYGEVRIWDNRIEKVSEDNRATVYFTNNTLYIENRNLMVFLAPGSKAIVLPARCLTDRDAAYIHQILRQALPENQRRIVESILPQAEQHIQQKEEKTDGDVTAGWEEKIGIDIQYTPQEFIEITQEKAGRGFVKVFPFYLLISAICGVIMGVAMSILWGVASGTFILCLAFLINVEGSHIRAKSMAKKMSQDALSMHVGFSEKGIHLKSPHQEEELQYLWFMVSRAIEHPSCIDFFAGNAFIRIPKRCILDLEELRAFVNRFLLPSSKEKKKGTKDV